MTVADAAVARERSKNGDAATPPVDWPQVQLASDYPRTATPTYDYQARELPFPTSWVEPLSGLPGAAPNVQSVWLAAWCAILYRYTQQEKFRLDVADRRDSGDASNHLAISIDAQSTGRRLAQSMEAALPAKVDCAPTHPVATVGVSFLTCGPSGAPAALVESICSGLPPGRELHLVCVQRDDLTLAYVVYNAALFGADAVDRVAQHLSMLLKGMVAHLDRPIADLPLLADQEAGRYLACWRGAAENFPTLPLHRYIESHAANTPDAIAVTFRDRHLTYAQLNRQANQIAHFLVAQGVGAGITVGVHIAASPDALACALGVFKAGGIYVPLEPTYPVQRLGIILEDTNPRVVFTQEALPSEILGKAPTCVLGRERSALDKLPTENLATAPQAEQAAFIVYTSGTTGKPKGVMLSYANLIHYLMVARDRYGYTAADVIPAFARFTFSITMFEVLSPLIAGARLIILERELILDFAKLTQVLRQPTALHASPSLLRRWLAYMADNAIDTRSFTRLRHISAGGDVVSSDLIESLKHAFPDAEVFVIYGSSEVSCMGCSYEAPRDRVVAKNYVGKPFKNVAVRLYDDHGNLVPIGVPGEIHFGGVCVAMGYLNAPEITREKFIDIDGERFYRMGDLGRFDAEGNLEFLGRNDFQIKLRGMRIELLEIETTLRRIAGVREAVVAEKQLVTGEKGLVAYVVLDEKAPTTVELRRSLQAKLPDYMVPSAFVVLTALPVNFNLKLDRKALPPPTADDLRNLGEYVPPKNETQRRLTDMWQSLLKVERIGVKDNFFDSGGNSLLSIDLVVQIEKAFGKTLPLSIVLTEPTIERLAQLMESDDSGQTGMVLLRNGGPLPPIFFIHDGEGEILPYRKLAYALPPSRPIYGITPFSRGESPMLHTRIADVVDHYTRQIQTIQASGPYTLGGLCIGGFIAYEIARRMRTAGQRVELIALIDAAHVNAPVRSINAMRVASFVANINPGDSVRRSFAARIATAARKVFNFAAYVARDRLKWFANQSRVRLFRFFLDRKWPIPTALRRIPVRVLLRFAEKEYVMPQPYDGKAILMRATQRDTVFEGTPIDDTPYIELFAEPLMGWAKQLPNLEVYDLRGGHSSMLQDPNVVDVAGAIMANLGPGRH